MKALDLFQETGQLFEALGEQQRQNIIVALAESEPLSVTELAVRIQLSQPATSHHLKTLLAAKLIIVERRGTLRMYSLDLMQAIGKLRLLVEAVEDNHRKKLHNGI